MSLRTVPPGFVVSGVFAARRALHALADLITPGELVLTEHFSGVMRTKLLGACARLGLAEMLDAGPLSSAEIASRSGTNPDVTHRVLRGLVALRVLDQRRDGRFATTRLLKKLLPGLPAATRDFAIYWGSASNVAAWNDLDRTLSSGEGAFHRVTGASVWDWFDAHPEERETFARAMGGLTSMVAPLVAARYPWSEVKTVCDVGGGRGMLLSEILLAHPHLSGILYDAQGVIDTAPELLDRRGVGARVQRVGGSFFTRVPSGADAYMLKNILHDWNDERSIHVLKNCRAAMRVGQRLVLVDLILEPDETGVLPTLSDLHMMIVCVDGRERSRADFRRVLEASGFSLGRVWDHPMTGIIEGIAI